MSSGVKVTSAVVLLVAALAVLGWYLRGYVWVPTAGKGRPADLTCLTCGNVDHSTWDVVITTAKHDKGLFPGYYLPCSKCGKPAIAHNPDQPAPKYGPRGKE